jgi:hypothetical protein
MHAQFHDEFSVFPCSPEDFAVSFCLLEAGKTGHAAQGSFALMGDSRPYSLVGCHAHSAQIPEVRLGHSRTPLLSALGRE